VHRAAPPGRKTRAIRKRADRFPFGLPKPDNANYLWIEMFWSALNETGRAGFVMANSAADARGSELDIRKALIESGAVDCIVSVGPNFFYTVTLPCTLWFLDKGKMKTTRKEEVLFIDARHVFRQIDRAHRDFTPAQIEFLANIVRLWRGQPTELIQGSFQLLDERELTKAYADVPGLCKAANLMEIEAQGWSLNPGRYVGASAREAESEDFREKLEELQEEFERLIADARGLEQEVAIGIAQVMDTAP
jgi:type I restriction enzyme M protein